MKKFLAVLMVTLTILTALTSCGKATKKESREDETRRILTSYIGVEYTDEGTQFEFADRESAEDFEYYWLDYGQRVSGVIWNSETDFYYITICDEYDFDVVCENALRGI
jgi:hypothetical protein